VLHAYLDESHDAKTERVFAVAAVFGSDEQWAGLKAKWLARAGACVFHAADCEAGRKAFAGRSREDNQALYADLVRILADSHLIGFGSVMDLKGYNEFFPDRPREIPYFRCFRDVVAQCGEWTAQCVPRDMLTVHIDRRFETDYNAKVLFSYFVTTPEWEHGKFLNPEMDIADRFKIGIQVADLYVREVMKHFENQLSPEPRPTRRSMRTLLASKRFGADFHTREFFESFHGQFDRLAEEAGVSAIEYEQWLLRTGQADSMSSRNRYLIETTPKREGALGDGPI